MKKVTIKGYAIKHKLSIFNVMKMVSSKKLKTVVEEEEGKEVTYIILEDKIEEEVENSMVQIKNIKDKKIEDELFLLRQEIKLLRDDIEILKRRCLNK